jgi:hypothetical protein
MKLYKVELDNVDYDTFDGCIVVAETEREVFEYITSSKVKGQFFIEEGQNIKITEINLDEYKEPAILLASFNAG